MTSPEDMLAPNAPFVVLDTETTGLDHKTEKLIELAAVKIIDGEIAETFHTLVNPQKPIRRSSFLIHGIPDEAVAEAPTIEEVLPKFLEFMGDLPYVAHSALFDYSFINEPHKAMFEGKRFLNHRIDTFEMYRSVFPDDPSHGLSSLLARFNFDSHVSHRALDDAMCLAKVYPLLRKLYEQKYAWQLAQMANIDYLVERYLRMQKAIQVMQSEMADLKDVFKVYFQNGGQSIQTTQGETMISTYRRTYSYDDAKVWAIALEGGFQEKVFKLNPRAADKLLGSNKITPEQKELLLDARLSMNESRQVTFLKPQAPSLELEDETEAAAIE